MTNDRGEWIPPLNLPQRNPDGSENQKWPGPPENFGMKVWPNGNIGQASQ